MSTPAKRTRTGCKTCRQRKLKCDETKPVCGQCRKSNRDCLPSEGVAFRHAQNAGFGGDDGGNDLTSFYKYRQKFNNTFFLPVPRDLSFVHVTDPYTSTEGPAEQMNPSHVYPPLPQHHHQDQHFEYPELPPAPGVDPDTDPENDRQYIDVAESSLKAMIDPSLEDAHNDPSSSKILGHHDTDDHVHHSLAGVADAADVDRINETIMKALQNTNAHEQERAQVHAQQAQTRGL